MTGKIRFKVLLTKKSIFDLKHLRNHDKLINDLKKQNKNHPKNRTHPETKNQPEVK
jgi:hypothetical protein